MPKYGHFVDPTTDIPLDFQEVSVKHLRGRKLSGWRGRLFPWVEIPRVKTLERIVFQDRDGHRWEVEEGFISDGASVPWWLWSVCHPFQSSVLAAALIHDVICKNRGPVTFWEAARIFWEAMMAQGYYKPRAYGNWAAVVVGGPKFGWKKNLPF